MTIDEHSNTRSRAQQENGFKKKLNTKNNSPRLIAFTQTFQKRTDKQC